MRDATFEWLDRRLKKLEVFFSIYNPDLKEDEKAVFERTIRFYLQDLREHLDILAERVEERINYVRGS